jgi:hypothetical protein
VAWFSRRLGENDLQGDAMSEREDQDLRDIFAAFAMQALVPLGYRDEAPKIDVAMAAYDVADAMLLARKVK